MKTALLFLIQIILVGIAFSFYHTNADQAKDNVHAQYFADRFNIATIFFAVYSLLFVILYFFTRNRASSGFGFLHFVLGLPLFLLTYAEQLGFYCHDPVPRRYYTYYHTQFDYFKNSTFFDVFPIFNALIYQITSVLFLLGIASFVFNLLATKRKKKTT